MQHFAKREGERLKTVSQKRGVDAKSTPYMDGQGPCTELAVGGMKKLAETPQNA